MRAIIRTLSFFEQWTAEVVRQPGLMFTLVLAPFLLLFAFGEGVKIGGARPKTVIVQAENAETPIEPFLEDLRQEVQIVGVTPDERWARNELAEGRVDAVAIVPPDPRSYIERGEQIPFWVLLGEVDPVRRNYATSYLKDQIAALNQRAVAEALGQASGQVHDMGAVSGAAREQIEALQTATNRDEARSATERLLAAIQPLEAVTQGGGETAAFAIPGLVQAMGDGAGLAPAVADLRASVDALDRRLASGGGEDGVTDSEIGQLEAALGRVEAASAQMPIADPAVLSAPFVLLVENEAPVEPSFTSYYSPGVLALLVHHLAVTLAALTLARMRLLRVTDLLRVAPVRTLEIVLGNYLSYAVLCGLAAAGLLAMLVLVLGVPVIGSYGMVVLVLALLTFSALGLGFLASQLSSSVQQAAQISMLVLLASVFFSGFAFSLDRITWPFRAISQVLPASYGIRGLQDVMLRGFEPRPLDLGVLAGMAIVLLVINVMLLRNRMAAS